MNLAIIPARGGSKRIPRKNIRDFHGKPIISYAILNCLNSNMFDEVMVSTDDNEIAEFAISCGAKVPFLRTEKNANDYATTADVLIEVLENYQKNGKVFESFCCLYPTTPLLKSERLKEAYQYMINNDFDTVFGVLKFDYPIQRALRFNKEKVEMIWEENLNKRSQDLESAYHDSGQFYWLKTERFLKNQKIFTSNSGAVVLDANEAQDIDNETDWQMTELKYSLLKKIILQV